MIKSFIIVAAIAFASFTAQAADNTECTPNGNILEQLQSFKDQSSTSTSSFVETEDTIEFTSETIVVVRGVSCKVVTVTTINKAKAPSLVDSISSRLSQAGNWIGNKFHNVKERFRTEAIQNWIKSNTSETVTTVYWVKG